MAARKHNWIPVVTGLIQREGKVLVGQRPEGHSLAGVWEFPGGKIEPNELPELALQRELKEEIGIDADIGDLVLASSHSYGQTGILLLFYRVRFWRGEIKAAHHAKLKWVKPKDLKELKLPEANYIILPKIIEALEVTYADHLSL